MDDKRETKGSERVAIRLLKGVANLPGLQMPEGVGKSCGLQAPELVAKSSGLLTPERSWQILMALQMPEKSWNKKTMLEEGFKKKAEMMEDDIRRLKEDTKKKPSTFLGDI
ncbi:unnamed protein product [Ranitomeya imitator]|uniref:Uncharacterized protein n=1 Tax=Ranitomeya imitator TaxID=111125 RepID=A0ABN9LZK7_9NEOB|nr:unnamed protein product [Ranitomeya imitator]